MLNKRYLPSLGFIILVMTIVSSGLFIKWAIGPLSYEEAQLEEKLGHQLAKEGKNVEAAKHFLKAAEIETDNISRSRQYRCVGTTSTSFEDKIKYFKLSLKYNPNNENALFELKNLYKIGPINYEAEKICHQLAKEGKNIEAAKYFLKAAEIETDNISRSRQYRCVGTTSTSFEDKIKYFKLSLKYNPNNENALLGLKNLYKNGFVYIDRWSDGWSQGKTGKIQIVATQDAKYRLTYSTSSPEKKDFEVIVSSNNKILEKKKIQSGKPNTLNFSLPEGNHEILISINHTFNPKKLRMSDDNRELGVHFIIEKLG